jgi:hypothetical protein
MRRPSLRRRIHGGLADPPRGAGRKQEIISEFSPMRRNRFTNCDDSNTSLWILKCEKFSLPKTESHFICGFHLLPRAPAGFEASLAKVAKGKLAISQDTRAIDGRLCPVYGGSKRTVPSKRCFMPP